MIVEGVDSANGGSYITDCVEQRVDEMGGGEEWNSQERSHGAAANSRRFQNTVKGIGLFCEAANAERNGQADHDHVHREP